MDYPAIVLKEEVVALSPDDDKYKKVSASDYFVLKEIKFHHKHNQEFQKGYNCVTQSSLVDLEM